MLFYQFDVSENNFEVADGDYIGWVNEDNNTWISASACVPARCQCSRSYYFWRSYNWPVPNRNSTFSCYRQYNFSVAVDIQPCTQVASLFIITLLINNNKQYSYISGMTKRGPTGYYYYYYKCTD